MTDTKLKPKHSFMHLNKSSLSLALPNINVIIEEEQKPSRAPITILQHKTKSNSLELF